ncbi:MAG: universal stress protein [Spirochaetes bacterium]|nr:universal stress protein [Spirochaetota bacterium]
MPDKLPAAAYRHFVVPLDGSRLAESVLPAVAALARSLKASVTLLHVVERRAPARAHGERHLVDRMDAETYLAGVARRAMAREMHASWHVHEGDAGGLARALAEHEREFGHDLVVLCTHGRGGSRRAVMGSVAQQLVNAGSVPVLVLRPPAAGSRGEQSFRSILLALDADPRHGEAAIGAAAELARAFGAVVHLVMIVPSFGLRLGRWMLTGRLLPSTTAALLDQSARDAERLVAKRCSALEKAGVRADARVLRGDPVRMLVRAAAEVEADLVALATHGRSGARALFTGSVASRVASLCKRPLLLAPAPRARRSSRRG